MLDVRTGHGEVPYPYLHPVELLDGVGIALGVLQLEVVPLGLLHEGGGGSNEQHQHCGAHDGRLKPQNNVS